MSLTKLERRARIRLRIRKKVKGTAQRPRLSIYRSNKFIYAQIIDDLAGNTLAAASSSEASIAKAPKIEQSKEVGKLIAERALAAGFTNVVFDRGGNLYHGRVKALAEGAREGGLNL